MISHCVYNMPPFDYNGKDENKIIMTMLGQYKVKKKNKCRIVKKTKLH